MATRKQPAATRKQTTAAPQENDPQPADKPQENDPQPADKPQENDPQPANKPQENDPQPEGRQEEVLIVTSAEPRRRAGFRFGPHETVIRQHEIDEEGVKALDEDPNISIRPGVRTFHEED